MAKPSYEEYMAAQRAKVEQRAAEQKAAVQRKESKPESLVGFDLGLCVADILNGTIKETSVRTVFLAGSADELEELINRCKSTCWAKNPKEGEAIARRLIEAGKIKEPTEGRSVSILGHWMNVEGVPAAKPDEFVAENKNLD